LLRLLRRDLIFEFSVGDCDDGFSAATPPRLSGSGGGEAASEMAKERRIGTRAGQRDANARGTFHHAVAEEFEAKGAHGS
jgi:hypothetical protein